MEYRKRPRQKKAKTERAKRPGRGTREKETDKWNTEKGQDGKS